MADELKPDTGLANGPSETDHVPAEPERVQLPPPPTATESPSEEKGVPFSVQLQKQRSDLEGQRDALQRNQRQVRLERLEKKRGTRVLVYYSFDIIYDLDVQLVYELLSRIPKGVDVDLILAGPGGFSDPAYKIARLCQQHVTEQGHHFRVLIPYAAKSALTILALGACEIVMGPMSELGPIDPQVLLDEDGGRNPYPLLGIKDAIDFIQAKISGSPETALLFMPLMEKIGLLSLGAFEREIASAKQYGTILLQGSMCKGDEKKAEELVFRI